MKITADLLRSILDSLPHGLVALDAAGRVLLINHGAEELLDLSASVAAGQRLAHLGAGGGQLAALAERVLAEGRPVREEDVRWVGRLGGARAVGASGAPRFDRRGRVAGAVLLLRDRTDPLGLVGPARQSADRDSFATVAAGVAHEVRNPLGGIRGAIQLLEAELGPGSQLCEHARVALREVDRLVRLTEQLLDLGRPPRSLAAPIHLHVLLDEVLAVCQRDPAARGVTFERIYDPSLPGLLGDAEALARLFLNLLRNAVEATGGRGRVAVSTGIETGVRLRAPSGGSGASAGVLRVSIADDGPGIPPEIQERLFLPFATGKPGGTGLGLALSRKVAIDHGGWIVCASAPGHGATFTVYLPAREGPP